MAEVFHSMFHGVFCVAPPQGLLWLARDHARPEFASNINGPIGRLPVLTGDLQGNDAWRISRREGEERRATALPNASCKRGGNSNARSGGPSGRSSLQ